MTRSVVLGYWQDRPPLEALAIAEAADRLGYAELWVGEMATFDAFALATAIGAQTRLALTIGPLAVQVRSATGMAMGVASVAALTGRAVHLAVGTSSDAVVTGWHGRPRTAAAQALEHAAAVLPALLGGERALGGYRLRLDPPGATLTVAAFGDRAIEVAARHADRMVLNMVTVDAVARLRTRLVAACDRLGQPVSPRLAVWLAAAVEPAEEALTQLARGFVMYLAAPGYGEMFAEAGYGDLVAAARAGAHPRELLAAVPPSLLRDVALVGPAAEIEDRIAAYHAAGVDEVCLVPATAGDPAGERTLGALGPAR